MKSEIYFKADNKILISLTDEELVDEINKNNNEQALEYLMDKYKTFVFSRVKSYFIVGAEKQDIIQEGLIGLFKAIKNFENDKQSSFKSFADLCVKRQIITAIKTSTRQKHIPLNNSISLNSTFDDDANDKTLTDVLENEIAPDPSDTIVNKETFFNIKTKITNVLSDFEKEVLNSHLCGYTYIQIANNLGVEPKSVDNAIQRIKKKMEKNIYNVDYKF